MPARLHGHRVADAGRAVGVVVHVRIGGDIASVATPDVRPAARPPLTGLVGDSPLWRRACDEAYAAASSGWWVALRGEAGTGKQALARALARRSPASARVALLDGRDAGTDAGWVAAARTAVDTADRVVLAHAGALTAVELHALAAVVQQAVDAPRSAPLWVALTVGSGEAPAALDGLLDRCGAVVDVPPLRLRPEDVPALAAHAARGRPAGATFTPAALGSAATLELARQRRRSCGRSCTVRSPTGGAARSTRATCRPRCRP